jgi:hypothetical protein
MSFSRWQTLRAPRTGNAVRPYVERDGGVVGAGVDIDPKPTIVHERPTVAPRKCHHVAPL